MKKLLGIFFVGVLTFGAAACGGSDDSSSNDDKTETTTADDNTAEFEQGSDEALAAAEDVIANGMPAEATDQYGEVTEVSCDPGIAEAEGEYDCDVEFEDGTTAVATVTTTGGEIKLQNLAVDGEE